MLASEDSLLVLSIDQCYSRLTQPAPTIDVDRPCAIGDGIEAWTHQDLEDKIARWDSHPSPAEDCGLWVPASGAATRMFQSLLNDASIQHKLRSNAERLALGVGWKAAVVKALGSWERASDMEAAEQLWLKMEKGKIPKGLVPFHVVHSGLIETAFEAHLRFWGKLFPSSAKVWFTVPSSQAETIKNHCLSSPFLPSHCRIQLPSQSTETDTYVLDDAGKWLLDEDGNMMRRPGGHGSLLPLLESIDAKLVVIRNIDNAPTPSNEKLRLNWTKALLQEARKWAEERDRWADALENEDSPVLRESILDWASSYGCGEFEVKHSEVKHLLACLRRPMRIAGVVPNAGQPGGGPFWVRSSMDDSKVTRQIVESVELSPEETRRPEATHFNPVDMVCVLRPGESLERYVDWSRYMIASKVVEGNAVHVLEHPGLWNGGMSDWWTRFVELPSACFEPVKTVEDLIGRQ